MSDREDDPLTKASSAPSTSTTKEVKISKARSQSPSAKPTAAPVVTLTTPSSPTEEARLTRSNTPPGLSMELAFKAQSQCGRVATLRRLLNMLPDDATDLNLEEIQRISTQADDLLKAFLKEHSYLEVTWPASCQGHAYITGNFLEAAHNISLDLKLKLAKLKSKAARTTLDEASSSTQPVPAKLPKIALPTFSGNYLEWPAYSELFASLVLNNTSISDVERLQYLRGSLFGAPLQLISALPLTGDSFASSWDILKQTYQNKRLLIQAQLEKLVSLSPVTQRSAKNLSDVIATVRDVDVALSTMATQEERWNALLIYQAVRCIDDVTREAWETHLGTADTFPPKRDLVNFITAKIRALQSVEATAGGSGQKPKPKTVAEAVKGQRSTSHAATQATQSRPPPSQPSTTTRAPPAQNTYPCDCCKEAHFLVSCTKFRAQTLQERLDLVQALSLCYNCLGRHITANCRSAHRCKDCGGRHHTLLHSTPSASKQ